MIKDKENNYHFTHLRGELVEVGELRETRPDHKVCEGVIRLVPGRAGTDRLPVVAFNKMAEAMTSKMRIGCLYDFSGYMLGNNGDGKRPGMNLHVCWSDRVNPATDATPASTDESN